MPFVSLKSQWSKDRSKKTLCLLSASLALSLLVVGCCTSVDPPRGAIGPGLPGGYQPFEWPQDFGGLPLAGALVQISKKQGFRYLITLQECGLDPDILTPIPGVIAIPSFTLNENADANLAAGFLSAVTLGASAKTAKKTVIQLGLSTDEMILPGRVVQNAMKNTEKLNKQCGKFLKLEGVFWVSDALRSQSFTLTFYDERGGKISVTADKLPQFISKVSAGANVSVTADGGVEIMTPVYIGFRSAPPAELLTGEIQTFAVGEATKVPLFGDEVYAIFRKK